MAQHIIVVDYDPCWEQQYLAEAKTIRAILGENCTAIFHIGSTAVRGLKAKPIIDIMPVVCSIAAVDEKQGAFEEIGYEYLGEFGMAQRRYLRKGGDERTHQVHIFQETDRINIERHLAVRDFLRAHSEIARQYGALKESLARRYPYDIEGYCDGKDAFVKDLEHQALRWKQNAPSSI
ncbi:GrpB family protein [uncultured Megasphaera sp.]|uniref:GrpB family protein n=1 Tax=uncultured Megasphaera sp. TaxID=165188 RepID=UPI00265D2A68|nr:GrpB family protein [uncultured Megasphaera sp.]